MSFRLRFEMPARADNRSYLGNLAIQESVDHIIAESIGAANLDDLGNGITGPQGIQGMTGEKGDSGTGSFSQDQILNTIVVQNISGASGEFISLQTDSITALNITADDIVFTTNLEGSSLRVININAENLNIENITGINGYFTNLESTNANFTDLVVNNNTTGSSASYTTASIDSLSSLIMYSNTGTINNFMSTNSSFLNISTTSLSSDINNFNNANIVSLHSGTGSFTNISTSGLTTSGDVIINGNITINGRLNVNSQETYKEGGQLWRVLSDRKFKKNIEDMSSVDENMLINTIEQISIKKFQYINSDDKIPVIGVIADELEKINPRSVKHSGDRMNVDFNDIFFGMIIYIKELKKRIDILESV